MFTRRFVNTKCWYRLFACETGVIHGLSLCLSLSLSVSVLLVLFLSITYGFGNLRGMKCYEKSLLGNDITKYWICEFVCGTRGNEARLV
jgi:uncharacterized protein YebE (UPF0316 family)